MGQKRNSRPRDQLPPQGLDFDHAHMAAVLRHWQRRWVRVKEVQAKMKPDQRAVVEKTGWRDFTGNHDEIVRGLASSTHPELVDAVIGLLDRDAEHHLSVAQWERVKEEQPTMDPHETKTPRYQAEAGDDEIALLRQRIERLEQALEGLQELEHNVVDLRELKHDVTDLEDDVTELYEWATDSRAGIRAGAKGLEIPAVPRRRRRR